MSVTSVANLGGKLSGSPPPPPHSAPKSSGAPKKGDILLVTAKGGLNVYDNVYTGQPGSSYRMGKIQALQKGEAAIATGQTAKDFNGNVYDQVSLANGKTGWIEAWLSSNGGSQSTVADLPGPQSSDWQSAIAYLRQNAKRPGHLKAFYQGLGPRGVVNLLRITAHNYDATKETVSTASPKGTENPYETIATALRRSGVNLDQWSHDLVSQAKGPLGSPFAIQGTRALFNQMVLDQAYDIYQRKVPSKGYPSEWDYNGQQWSESCAMYSYQSLKQAGVRGDILNQINGGPGGANSAIYQYDCAAGNDPLHLPNPDKYGHRVVFGPNLLGGGGSMSGGRIPPELTPGAIVFDPHDSPNGHVAIYAGLGNDGKAMYLTTTGWGRTDGSIQLWSLDHINRSEGGFQPKGWLDLTAG